MRVEPRRAFAGFVWTVMVGLAILGIASAIGRALFVADMTERAERARPAFLGVPPNEVSARQRVEDLRRFDSRFAAHPVLTRLHVLPGALFLALAPLQFLSAFRTRHIDLHRWLGRCLLVVACLATLSSLEFGLRTPVAGLAEAVPIALVAGLFLTALGRAYFAIRSHQVSVHREWMIRAFALAIGISTVRVAGAVFDVLLMPAGFRETHLLVAAIWTGWLLTLGAAEIWIRHTRADRPSPALS